MKVTQLLEGEISSSEIFNQPFFKYNALTEVLWHKTTFEVDTVELRTFKSRSKPKDTNLLSHMVLGQISEEELGFNVRQETIFTYGSSNHSNFESIDFGPLHAIVPKGDYELYYSRGVSDLTLDRGITHPWISVNYTTRKTFSDEFMAEFSNDIQQEIKLQFSTVDVESDLLKRAMFFGAANIHESILEAINVGIYTLSDYREIVPYINEKLDQVSKKISEVKFASKRYGPDDSSFVISDELQQKMHTYSLEILQRNVEDMLGMIRQYYENMNYTKKASEVGDEEVMLRCKEFYIISLEHYKYLVGQK